MLEKVLEIAGISNVIWIDDRFDKPRVTEVDLIALLATACASGAHPTHRLLAHLGDEVDVAIWTAEATNIQQASEADRTAVIDELRSIAGLSGDGATDYSVEQLAALREALRNATCMSLEDWRQQRDELRPTFGVGTLLLLDRQFMVEGRSEDLGELELAALVSAKTGGTIVILTHSVTTDAAAEDLRYELARKYELPVSAFAVMPKGADTQNAVASLAASVRTIFTHKACEMLTREVGDVLSQSVKKAADEFLGHSLVELDRVIFANSRDEGASEFDVVVRVLTLRARVLSEVQLFADLTRLAHEIVKVRNLHELTTSAQESRRALSQLGKWRRDEVYDSHERINPVFLPLSCGDIFHTDAGKRYVLLGQPCDFAVRQNGDRSLKEASFVRIKETRSSSTEVSRWHKLPAYEGEVRDWWLDYKEVCVVSLQYLEYAAMNPNGDVSLSLSQNAESLLLPGWRIRFEKAIRSLAGRLQEEGGKATSNGNTVSEKAALLALSDVLGGKRWGKLDHARKQLSFPFKRVARLRQPYAQAAWADLAAFQLRPAFPHDFSRGTEERAPGGENNRPADGDEGSLQQ